MRSPTRPRYRNAALLTAALAIVGACGSDTDDDSSASETSVSDDSVATDTASASASATESTEASATTATTDATTDTTASDDTASAAGTIEITDFQGTVEVPVPAERIVVTDNRVVRALDAWGIDIVAAPLDIFPSSISYASDDSVLNLGNHGEPDLEALVAADPDLVLTGYRFQDYYGDIVELVPDAAVVDTTTDYENKPLDEELSRQLLMVGTAVGHEDDAQALVDELDASIGAATAAYDPAETVMGLITSGGDIGYVAPVTGRAIGPLYSLLGLTPSLEQDGDSGDTGDDISVEAIAASNPDWIIVLDRDAAVAADTDEYQSAEELLLGSEALANVTAVQENNIIYLPADFYLTEDVQAYTEIFNSIAAAMGEG